MKNNTRTLNTKLQNLEDALAKTNVAHTSWVSKAELTSEQLADEQFSSEWLESQWDAVSLLRDKVEEILEIATEEVKVPTQTTQQKLAIYDKQMESLQMDITSEIDNIFNKTSENTLNSAAHKRYDEMLKSLKIRLQQPYAELSEKILALVKQDEFPEKLNDHEHFRQTQQQKLLVIQLQLADNAPIPEASSSYTTPNPISTRIATRGIEMEKSKAPTFSGRTIEYPGFKRGWKKVAGVVWDDSNQVEQIKLKVDVDSKRIIERCNSMDEVWDALDLEYGQEQEVINAVEEELRSLKEMNCTTAEYMVKL